MEILFRKVNNYDVIKQLNFQSFLLHFDIVLPRLSVTRLTGIQLSGRSILLPHFKIRLLLTRCCRNSFREILR